jgi:hypothetical protein
MSTTAERVQPALQAFLDAHDHACADWGRGPKELGTWPALPASFAAFADAAGALTDEITAGPGHPVMEAMASAVSLYHEAATWGSMITEPTALGVDAELGVTLLDLGTLVPDAAGSEIRSAFGRTSVHAMDRWTEWAPRFFEHVGIPDVPAPKLCPTYLDSETVPRD